MSQIGKGLMDGIDLDKGRACPAYTPLLVNRRMDIGRASLALQTTPAVVLGQRGHDAPSPEVMWPKREVERKVSGVCADRNAISTWSARPRAAFLLFSAVRGPDAEDECHRMVVRRRLYAMVQRGRCQTRGRHVVDRDLATDVEGWTVADSQSPSENAETCSSTW